MYLSLFLDKMRSQSFRTDPYAYEIYCKFPTDILPGELPEIYETITMLTDQAEVDLYESRITLDDYLKFAQIMGLIWGAIAQQKAMEYVDLIVIHYAHTLTCYEAGRELHQFSDYLCYSLAEPKPYLAKRLKTLYKELAELEKLNQQYVHSRITHVYQRIDAVKYCQNLLKEITL